MRVPPTEKKGRRHSSNVFVSFLSETNNVFKLDSGDTIEKFVRGSGPGGQHRNKTASDVKLTHIPTGISVTIQGRSQWKNRKEAHSVLEAKLNDHYSSEAVQVSRKSKNADRDSGRAFTWRDWTDQVINHDTGKKTSMKKALKGKLNPIL